MIKAILIDDIDQARVTLKKDLEYPFEIIDLEVAAGNAEESKVVIRVRVD